MLLKPILFNNLPTPPIISEIMSVTTTTIVATIKCQNGTTSTLIALLLPISIAICSLLLSLSFLFFVIYFKNPHMLEKTPVFSN